MASMPPGPTPTGPRPAHPLLDPVVNAVYYPSWRVYKGLSPARLRVNDITHIFYAFVRVNEDGSLRTLDEYADLQISVDNTTGCLSALAKLKHAHPHLKTILSIGGGGGSAEFPALAAHPGRRRTFATAVRGFLNRHALDGADIDWEHPTTAAQAADYLALLHDLRRELPAPRYLLTTALPVSRDCLGVLDLGREAQVLDLVNLMGYDFTGPWGSLAGHHARLLPLPQGSRAWRGTPPQLRTSVHHGVDYLIRRGVPRDKILLGVPAYARFFPRADAPGKTFDKNGCGEIDYCDLPREWIERAHVDEDAGAAWLVDWKGSKGFVSLDVPRTVRQKAGYAKSMGLRGLFYWTGVGDVSGTGLSLVEAGAQGLREL